jgi:hypothetical protein
MSLSSHRRTSRRQTTQPHVTSSSRSSRHQPIPFDESPPLERRGTRRPSTAVRGDTRRPRERLASGRARSPEVVASQDAYSDEEQEEIGSESGDRTPSRPRTAQRRVAHPKRKLARNESDEKPFSSSYLTIASPPRPLKRGQWLKLLYAIDTTHLPPGLFIGFSDAHLIKLIFVLTGKDPTCKLSDFYCTSKRDFRSQMKSFSTRRVLKNQVPRLETWSADDTDLVSSMAEKLGWDDGWLIDESEKKATEHVDMVAKRFTDSFKEALAAGSFAPPPKWPNPCCPRNFDIFHRSLRS